MDTITRTQTPTRLDIEAVFDALCQAWNAGDPTGIAATFAPDGRIIDPFGGEWDGHDAVLAAYQQNFEGRLAGTTTAIDIKSVRELAPGVAIVDGWQTITGPLGGMHLTAVLRAAGETVQLVECRPYVLLVLPSEG
jgi:uncharacterized protein (TIGR02246 family)